MATRNDRHLTMAELVDRIEDGDIDTVVVAFTDMQGRLQGKRLHGRYFVDHVVDHGTEGCNYLLAVDVDMNTVDGYAISSWDKGYGDMEFVLDHDTIRLLTHLPATAMVQCDLVWPDHSPVVQSPRAILKKQLDRVAEHGWTALAGTELEFIAFDTPYEEAHDNGYRDLTPSNQYNVDYSILGTSRVEPLLRDIRNHMYAAGMDVEGAKGECNFGQHEIGFLYAEALVTADNHAVYKNAGKEIAAQHGKSITFMAKYNEREGNSCHIHLSLRGTDGGAGLLGRGGGRPARRSTTSSSPACSRRSPTSRCSTRRTSTPTSGSPTGRSRRRRSPGGSTTAPAPSGWSATGRRPDGEPGPRRRREPLPRARRDAGRRPARHRERAGARGRAGRQRLHVRDGRRCRDDARRPRGLRHVQVARAAFGDEVVDHYVNMADVELAAFDAAVTDWELRRGFERL